MAYNERASVPAAERRAADQTHRLVTGNEEVRQQRSGADPEAADDLDESADRPAETRWMSEGGALADGPGQTDGGTTPEDD